jgi:hypothetical protein
MIYEQMCDCLKYLHLYTVASIMILVFKAIFCTFAFEKKDP